MLMLLCFNMVVIIMVCMGMYIRVMGGLTTYVFFPGHWSRRFITHLDVDGEA